MRAQSQIRPQACDEAYTDPPREALEGSLTSVVKELCWSCADVVSTMTQEQVDSLACFFLESTKLTRILSHVVKPILRYVRLNFIHIKEILSLKRQMSSMGRILLNLLQGELEPTLLKHLKGS